MSALRLPPRSMLRVEMADVVTLGVTLRDKDLAGVVLGEALEDREEEGAAEKEGVLPAVLLPETEREEERVPAGLTVGKLREREAAVERVCKALSVPARPMDAEGVGDGAPVPLSTREGVEKALEEGQGDTDARELPLMLGEPLGDAVTLPPPTPAVPLLPRLGVARGDADTDTVSVGLREPVTVGEGVSVGDRMGEAVTQVVVERVADTETVEVREGVLLSAVSVTVAVPEEQVLAVTEVVKELHAVALALPESVEEPQGVGHLEGKSEVERVALIVTEGVDVFHRERERRADWLAVEQVEALALLLNVAEMQAEEVALCTGDTVPLGADIVWEGVGVRLGQDAEGEAEASAVGEAGTEAVAEIDAEDEED